MRLQHLILLASAFALGPGSALAQAMAPAAQGPVLTVGAVIYDPKGGEVGKIDSITNDAVVVDTGAHKATLPKSAFGSGPKGPSITIGKAEIDAQVAAALDKAAERIDALLVPGAEVRGKSGALVGVVKEVNADQVVIDRASGPVSLARSAFGTDQQGLTIAMTAAEFDAAASAVSPKP